MDNRKLSLELSTPNKSLWSPRESTNEHSQEYMISRYRSFSHRARQFRNNIFILIFYLSVVYRTQSCSLSRRVSDGANTVCDTVAAAALRIFIFFGEFSSDYTAPAQRYNVNVHDDADDEMVLVLGES